jgi:alpha-tubulin suppressor-like RCC1 family protein
MTAITNFKEQGSDLSDVYVTKEYMMEYYPDLVPDLKTPQLWSWGDNRYGQLGNNSTVEKSVPTTISGGGTNWKQISVGERNAAAIKTDGTLWTWGEGGVGALGNNSTVNRSSPGTVSGGGTNWKQVGACFHMLAIKTDGTLWSWGTNDYGQLGINSTVNRSSPGTVSGGGTNWKQISVTFYFNVAIKTDGTLWTWGYNSAGNLGNNSTIDRSSPGTVSGSGTTWKEAVCNLGTMAAIKTDGTLWTWGSDNYGELGHMTKYVSTSSPITVSGGGTTWKQVSVGRLHMLATKTDGTLWVWGNNGAYQLATKYAYFGLDESSPVTCHYGGTNWKFVSAINYSSFAIKTDGTLWSWGRDWLGVLGTGLIGNKSSPIRIGSNTNWKSLAPGTDEAASMAAISEAEGW